MTTPRRRTGSHGRGPWRRRIAVGVLAAIVVLVSSGAPARADEFRDTKPQLIIDTDFGQWFDDIAALAAAHTAADRGHARLLGVIADVTNPHIADAIDAVNTAYGRPDLPVGVPATAMAVPDGYSRTLAACFAHRGRPTEALALYRRLLTDAPDRSVTIVAIGALTNLAELQRTDRQLIARKVTQTVIMGGQYPHADAPEWNFGLDPHATAQVVNGWPTPMVYAGYEVGARVFAGNQVCATHPAGSPVRAVFDQLYGCGTSQHDGSWDPTALLYALHGTRSGLQLTGSGGHNTINADGSNRWQPGERHQRYLTLADPAQATRQIDALLNRPPHR